MVLAHSITAARLSLFLLCFLTNKAKAVLGGADLATGRSAGPPFCKEGLTT